MLAPPVVRAVAAGVAQLLAGTAIMLAALAVLLAMVAGAVAPGIALSLGAYAALFGGMVTALAGILRLAGRR